MSPLTKQEKLDVFNNDLRVRSSTYADHAAASANEAGGRFKKELETRVDAVPQYPKLPPNNPWSEPDPVPDEPALGFEIDALEPGATTEKGD